MPLVIGIDPSLTATGIVVLRNGEVERAITTKNRPELGTMERVRQILNSINGLINEANDLYNGTFNALDLIVIEGFSYGSKGRSVFDTAYLGWRIREELERLRIDRNIPWVEIPPSQLKKFATGKGNANKEIMLQQVYKRWNYETDNNNIADAYVLAQIGRALVEDNLTLTAFQQEVIEKIKKEGLK